jgi:hypothetical protein
MRGFVPVPGGVVGRVIAGGLIGYAHAKGYVPVKVQFQDYIVSGLVGGLPAVAGDFAGRIVAGGLGSTVQSGTTPSIKVLG